MAAAPPPTHISETLPALLQVTPSQLQGSVPAFQPGSRFSALVKLARIRSSSWASVVVVLPLVVLRHGGRPSTGACVLESRLAVPL